MYLSLGLLGFMTRSRRHKEAAEAIAKYGRPEIFNTDQGSQFTSAEFIGILKANEIRISMDGNGRWVSLSA